MYSVYLDFLSSYVLKQVRNEELDTKFVCVGTVSPASPVAQGRPSLVLSAWLKSWPLRAAADSLAPPPPHALPCLHPLLEQCGASPANTHTHIRMTKYSVNVGPYLALLWSTAHSYNLRGNLLFLETHCLPWRWSCSMQCQ